MILGKSWILDISTITVTNIRSSDNLFDVWSNIQQGKNIFPWCNGLKMGCYVQNKHLANVAEVSDEDHLQGRNQP